MKKMRLVQYDIECDDVGLECALKQTTTQLWVVLCAHHNFVDVEVEYQLVCI